jgi:hypothetical protein
MSDYHDEGKNKAPGRGDRALHKNAHKGAGPRRKGKTTGKPEAWQQNNYPARSGNYEKPEPRGPVKRRAEYIARMEVGDASEWEQFVEQAEGDVSWDAYEAWLKRKGWQFFRGYEYPNDEGNLLYEALRYEYHLMPSKKKFVLRHREGDTWVRGAGPVRVPYNLPELLARPNDEIDLVEGEKGAEYVKKAGRLASCVQGQNWTDDVAMSFAGRSVNVVMYNDDAGRDNIADACAWLAKVQATVRVLTLPGAAPRAGLDDWLEEHSVEEYQALVAKTKPVLTDGLVNVKPYIFPEPASIPPWDWLYGNHLLRKTVSGTAAMSGTGKSSKSIVEALAMATCKPLLSVQPPRPLRVLLINLEDNRNAMDKRIAAAMKHYGLKHEDVGDRLTVIAKGEMKLKIATQTRSGVIVPDEVAIRGMIDYIIANKIDVVSIDPLRMTHRINENDNSAIGDLIECYDQIAEAADCAVHLWHHTRKAGGGEVTIESARGAQAFVDACRSVNVMEIMTKEEAKKSGIEEQRRKYYFRAFSGNLNFAPPMDQSDWFEFKSMNLNNGPLFGDDVGVATSWTHPGVKKADLSPGTIAEIKRAVGTEQYWREHQLAAVWVGKAIAPILGLDHDETGVQMLKKTIKELITMKALKTSPGRDSKRREPTMFVVAT